MLKIFIISLAIAFISSAIAEEKAPTKKNTASKVNDEDLIITSKHLNYDHVNRQAIFTRDVKAINGATTMTADKMICYFDEKNDPYLVIAEGNVIILRGDQKAKSEKAVYKITDEIIILRQQPELFDGKNTIKARIITFYEAKNISEFDDPDCKFFRAPNKEKTPVADSKTPIKDKTKKP